MTSPYLGAPPDQWPAITSRLIEEHPLDTKVLVEIVKESWRSIFESRFGVKGFRIGKEYAGMLQHFLHAPAFRVPQ